MRQFLHGSLDIRSGRPLRKRERGNEEMTPQDVVSLAPPRGFLTLVALVLTAMASCFWTCETDVEAELAQNR